MNLDPSADLDRLDLLSDRNYAELGQKMDDLIEYVIHLSIQHDAKLYARLALHSPEQR